MASWCAALHVLDPYMYPIAVSVHDSDPAATQCRERCRRGAEVHGLLGAQRRVVGGEESVLLTFHCWPRWTLVLELESLLICSSCYDWSGMRRKVMHADLTSTASVD